ncbi:16387_t:CDS:2, partial [Acaulospora colombiana]
MRTNGGLLSSSNALGDFNWRVNETAVILLNEFGIVLIRQSLCRGNEIGITFQLMNNDSYRTEKIELLFPPRPAFQSRHCRKEVGASFPSNIMQKRKHKSQKSTSVKTPFVSETAGRGTAEIVNTYQKRILEIEVYIPRGEWDVCLYGSVIDVPKLEFPLCEN